MRATPSVNNPAVKAAYARRAPEAFLKAAAVERVLAGGRRPSPARRGSDDLVEKQSTVVYSHIG
jgi:hypothetical protein